MMTNTPPPAAPLDEQGEVAEKARQVVVEIVGADNWEDALQSNGTIIYAYADTVAAALAAARAQALAEARDLICGLCANGVQYVDGMHQHPGTGEWVNCKAIAIHRELRALKGQGHK